MKKLMSFLLLSLLVISCATETVSPVGSIKKINSLTHATVSYPEVNLKKGDSVKLIKVFWTMGRRNETVAMNGVVENSLEKDLYEIKFDGTKTISETNIIRK